MGTRVCVFIYVAYAYTHASVTCLSRLDEKYTLCRVCLFSWKLRGVWQTDSFSSSRNLGQSFDSNQTQRIGIMLLNAKSCVIMYRTAKSSHKV